MRNIVVLCLVFIVVVTGTVPRRCDTTRCNSATPVKFCNTGSQRCKDLKIGPNAQKLPCEAESVLPAESDTKHCGSGGGGHVLWLGPHPEFGCDRWVPINNNGESTVIFNEFDNDGDGINDEATFSGFLRCDRDRNNAATHGKLEIQLFLKAVGWKPKVELGCFDGADAAANKKAADDLVSTWYMYDHDPSVTSFLFFHTGPNANTFIPIQVLKGMAVGFGASQKNALFGGSTWLSFVLPSSNGTCGPKQPQLFQDGDLNFNLQCQCRCCDDPPPPPPVCGNGRVEGTEECDSNELCCKDCKFVTGGTVCRPSAGICDVPETCTGSDEKCPDDAFVPNTVTCATTLGVCEFKTDIKCPGNGPFCSRLPNVPLHPIPSTFENYNLVAFGNVNCNTGDVEGRVIAEKDVTFGEGFSVGAETRNLESKSDAYEYYGLVAGGKLTWGNGQFYPTGESGIDFYPNTAEFIFSGQSPAVPTHLGPLVEGTCSGVAGCLNAFFADAHNGYTALSDSLAGLTPTVTKLKFQFNGLFIDCQDDGAQVDQYVLEIPEDKWTSITWFNLRRCNLAAAWVINIPGSGNVLFSGGSWPGVAERTVFNVPGTGRVITVSGTQLRGNLLAPNCDLDFPTGLIVGKVIIRNVLSCNQINRPNCPIIKPIPCTCQLKRDCDPDSPVLVCRGGHCYRPGDSVSVGGKTCQVEKVIEDQNDSDSCFLECRSNVGVSRPAGDFLIAQISGVDLRKESTPVVGPEPVSVGSTMVVSVAALLVALVAALF